MRNAPRASGQQGELYVLAGSTNDFSKTSLAQSERGRNANTKRMTISILRSSLDVAHHLRTGRRVVSAAKAGTERTDALSRSLYDDRLTTPYRRQIGGASSQSGTHRRPKGPTSNVISIGQWLSFRLPDGSPMLSEQTSLTT